MLRGFDPHEAQFFAFFFRAWGSSLRVIDTGWLELHHTDEFTCRKHNPHAANTERTVEDTNAARERGGKRAAVSKSTVSAFGGTRTKSVCE